MIPPQFQRRGRRRRRKSRQKLKHLVVQFRQLKLVWIVCDTQCTKFLAWTNAWMNKRTNKKVGTKKKWWRQQQPPTNIKCKTFFPLCHSGNEHKSKHRIFCDSEMCDNKKHERKKREPTDGSIVKFAVKYLIKLPLTVAVFCRFFPPTLRRAYKIFFYFVHFTRACGRFWGRSFST